MKGCKIYYEIQRSHIFFHAGMSPQRHRRTQRFGEQKHGEMIRQAAMLSLVTSSKHIRAQIVGHVQIAYESPDLNMDFCGFQQLQLTNSYARIFNLKCNHTIYKYIFTCIALAKAALVVGPLCLSVCNTFGVLRVICNSKQFLFLLIQTFHVGCSHIADVHLLFCAHFTILFSFL